MKPSATIQPGDTVLVACEVEELLPDFIGPSGPAVKVRCGAVTFLVSERNLQGEAAAVS